MKENVLGGQLKRLKKRNRAEINEFKSLANGDLLRRLEEEVFKAELEEEIRGGEGTSTSRTQWRIVVLQKIIKERRLEKSD